MKYKMLAVDAETHKKIKEICEREGRTLSGFARTLVETYMKKMENKKEG